MIREFWVHVVCLSAVQLAGRLARKGARRRRAARVRRRVARVLRRRGRGRRWWAGAAGGVARGEGGCVRGGRRARLARWVPGRTEVHLRRWRRWRWRRRRRRRRRRWRLPRRAEDQRAVRPRVSRPRPWGSRPRFRDIPVGRLRPLADLKHAEGVGPRHEHGLGVGARHGADRDLGDDHRPRGQLGAITRVALCGGVHAVVLEYDRCLRVGSGHAEVQRALPARHTHRARVACCGAVDRGGDHVTGVHVERRRVRVAEARPAACMGGPLCPRTIVVPVEAGRNEGGKLPEGVIFDADLIVQDLAADILRLRRHREAAREGLGRSRLSRGSAAGWRRPGWWRGAWNVIVASCVPHGEVRVGGPGAGITSADRLSYERCPWRARRGCDSRQEEQQKRAKHASPPTP